MDTPESPAPPFIQANNDFFHGLRDRVDASLPVATNIVFTLLDDIAVPAGADRSARRVYRLHRDNSILFFDQWDRFVERTEEKTTIRATGT